jgi:hypothetical protein
MFRASPVRRYAPWFLFLMILLGCLGAVPSAGQPPVGVQVEGSGHPGQLAQ